MNRDAILRSIAERLRRCSRRLDEAERPQIDEDTDIGLARGDHHPRASTSSEFVGTKRDAMRAHASQIADRQLLPGHARGGVRAAFGTEWFIAHGKTRPADAPFGDDLFAALDPI